MLKSAIFVLVALSVAVMATPTPATDVALDKRCAGGLGAGGLGVGGLGCGGLGGGCGWGGCGGGCGGLGWGGCGLGGFGGCGLGGCGVGNWGCWAPFVATSNCAANTCANQCFNNLQAVNAAHNFHRVDDCTNVNAICAQNAAANCNSNRCNSNAVVV